MADDPYSSAMADTLSHLANHGPKSLLIASYQSPAGHEYFRGLAQRLFIAGQRNAAALMLAVSDHKLADGGMRQAMQAPQGAQQNPGRPYLPHEGPTEPPPWLREDQ